MGESLKKSIDWGREVIRIEAEAVAALSDRIDESFARAVELLAQGAVHLEPWTVQAPLAEGGAWFDRLVEGTGVAKVLLVP